MIFHRHTGAIWLMRSSMLLLGLFLAWWLRNVYVDEVDGIKRETAMLLSATVRGLEAEAMKSFVSERLFIRRINTGQNGRVEVFSDSLFVHDSIKMIAFAGEGDFPLPWVDTAGREPVRVVQHSVDNPAISGTLSIMIDGNAPNEPHISLKRDSITIQLDQLLEKRLRTESDSGRLALHYEVIRVGDTSILPATNILGSYQDLPSGERFDVVSAGYRSYILRKMWPQLLFSLLLFSSIGGAFYLTQRNLREQERLADMKDDFINNVTHELQTPIATVSVALEALGNFNVLHQPERAGEYLDISRHELSRLSMLVDKVLKMSLFERDQAALQYEDLDLSALITHILATMRLQFEKYKAHVQLQIDPGHYVVAGDRTHLISVLYNLLDNALKYSTGEPDIEVFLSQSDGEAECRISDRGIGIPEAYQDKIFDKFFRIPNGDVHNVKGHGVGLHYAAGVIQRHSGSIRVVQRQGGGSSFVFRIPLKDNS